MLALRFKPKHCYSVYVCNLRSANVELALGFTLLGHLCACQFVLCTCMYLVKCVGADICCHRHAVMLSLAVARLSHQQLLLD